MNMRCCLVIYDSIVSHSALVNNALDKKQRLSLLDELFGQCLRLSRGGATSTTLKENLATTSGDSSVDFSDSSVFPRISSLPVSPLSIVAPHLAHSSLLSFHIDPVNDRFYSRPHTIRSPSISPSSSKKCECWIRYAIASILFLSIR